MFSKLLTQIGLVGVFGVWAATPAWSQDELRVRQLENEVSRLQRELDAQSRRIEELERTTRAPGATIPSSSPATVRRSAESSPAWLVSSSWDRIKPGMKELDVIALLGRPTSVRPEDDGKTHALLYALELGSNAILAGSVRMNDSGVTEINKPKLR